MQIAVLPPGAAAPRPRSQLAVLEEVLVALGGEARERFGPLPGLEAGREQPQRPLVDLGGGELQIRVAAVRLIEHAWRRRVAEIPVLGANHRRRDRPRPHAPVPGDPADRGVGTLEPGRAHQAHAGQPEEHLRARGTGRRRLGRNDREAYALDLPQAQRTLRDGVGPEGDAVQPPPGGAVGASLGIDGRDHRAVPHVRRVVADREHETDEALGGAHPRHGVELEIAVRVFRVHEAVVPPAAGAEVAESVGLEHAVLGGAAQRQRVHERAGGGVEDRRGAVGQNTLVVERRVPGMGERLALGIEPPQPDEALAVVQRVAAAGRVAEGFRRPRQRVFEQRTEIEDQRRAVRLRRAVLVLPHPQLDVLDARQVDPRR